MFGGALALVGPTLLDAASGGATDVQVDLAGVEAGPRRDQRPIFIGEVKATDARVGIDQLARLDYAVMRLGAVNCHRLLFSRTSASKVPSELVGIVSAVRAIEDQLTQVFAPYVTAGARHVTIVPVAESVQKGIKLAGEVALLLKRQSLFLSSTP